MYVKRVGEPTEFAAYPPLEIKGDQLLFEFDELLFSKDTGRYAGRLTIGGEDYSTVYLEYVRPYGVTAVENPHV